MKLELIVFPKNTWLASKLQIRSKDFVKFCTMKGTRKHMKFILVVFQKRTLLRVNGLFWA